MKQIFCDFDGCLFYPTLALDSMKYYIKIHTQGNFSSSKHKYIATLK